MLIPQLGYGGAEKSFIRLANFLSEQHDVSIALFDKSFGDTYAANTADALNESIEIIYLGSQGNRLVRWINRWKRFRILKNKMDISISFLSGSNLLNVLAGTNTPSIISERGSKKYDILIIGWKRILWLKILDPMIYRLSTKIVTVSEGLSSEILENRRNDLKNKVIAIEGYIDSQKLLTIADEEVERRFLDLQSYPTIVAVGRLSKQKGFEYLLHAFSKVKKSIPDSKLLLVGDGPEFDMLKTLADDLNLKIAYDTQKYKNADVIFAGYQRNPSKYFKVGRVVAFSSLYEGLPNVLIEAVASGVPILASDCPWGSRSVLGISKNVDEEPLPIISQVGVLMPMINKTNGISIWSEYLIDHLLSPKDRLTYQKRIASI